jgi:pimeloyl-ACP methyl ester carboxylesterase
VSDGWSVLASGGGVTLRSQGSGTPVLVVPGMEGSGESCLDLVLPVLTQGPPGSAPARAVLVDYAAEQHPTFDALVETLAGLVTDTFGPSPALDLWGQSFGNLVGLGAVAAVEARIGRAVLVSAFPRLPAWKVWVEPPLARSSPTALYRATAVPVARWQFGPTGGNLDHPFFGAMRTMPKADVARRTAWLRGRDFEPMVVGVAPTRGGVWLGSRDRLVDRDDVRRCFTEHVDPERLGFSIIEGAGHVALPVDVIARAQQQLGAWFWERS